MIPKNRELTKRRFIASILLSFSFWVCSLTPAKCEEMKAVVATVNGIAIAQDELEEAIRDARAQFEEKIRELKSSVLAKMIDNELLRQEAAKRGTSVEAILLLEVESVSVNDAEVIAEWKRVPAWPPATLPAEAKYRVRKRMEDERKAHAYQSLVRRLHANARVVNVLQQTTANLTGGKPTIIGPSRAKVTVVVFSDYRCGYCRKSEQAVRGALERWRDDVRVVVRHFPLSEESGAPLAAKAAFCASDQGKFEEFHRALFTMSDFSVDSLHAAAQGENLQIGPFTRCLESPHTQARLQAEIRLGQEAGVRGTPTFFVDGERLNSVGELAPRLESLLGSIATASGNME
jgi:protein-disulfide isomerase